MKHLSIIVTLLLFATLIGCGKVKVEGKVAFPDGTPLTKGKVVFEDAAHTFTSKIQSDGTFRMGALKDGEGIPPGKYSVGVAEAFDETFPAADAAPIIKHLIREKFRSPKTSEIEYNIEKNTRDISITVEKP